MGDREYKAKGTISKVDYFRKIPQPPCFCNHLYHWIIRPWRFFVGRRRTRLKKKHSRRDRLVTIGSSCRSLDFGMSSADQVFNLKVTIWEPKNQPFNWCNLKKEHCTVRYNIFPSRLDCYSEGSQQVEAVANKQSGKAKYWLRLWRSSDKSRTWTPSCGSWVWRRRTSNCQETHRFSWTPRTARLTG